jgi:filamentous hemagglutinin family protein
MNRIYRLVWNATLGIMVAVAENAKGRGKSVSGRKLIAAALALTGGAVMLPQAMAGPTGGQVSAGAGAIAQAGLNTTITQTSQNLAINWQNFSIAANEAVRFNQPNASAIALNRVTSQNPSVILGGLSANGNVFVLNPNGVLFGAGAQVDVGGLVASTLNLSDADLMAGKFTFSSAPGQLRSSVVNQGAINIAPGGYVALLAPEVRNEGVIIANQGAALLAAGEKVTLNMNNGSLVSYSIDQGAINALAENKQLIQADGGHIVMSAKAADALTTAVVNNTGVIRARTVQNVNGTIRLMGDMKTGTVNVGGTLDASAPAGGNGGFIETSAAHVKVANDAKITTAAAMGFKGTWLIDPVDFTIAASGGDITGAALSILLGANNIYISTGPVFPLTMVDPATGLTIPMPGYPVTGVTTMDPVNTAVPAVQPITNLPVNTPNAHVGGVGDINVNDVVTWSANKLTLNAENNIHINANLNVSGTASLALEYGQANVNAGNASNYYVSNGAQVNLPAGQNFSTKLGYDGATTAYTVITDIGVAADAAVAPAIMTLQGTAAAPTGNYVLGANIQGGAAGLPAADGVASLGGATSTWNGGAGFTPIGGSTTALTSAGGFAGVFDGLGHTINNLTIATPNALAGTASVYVGLFGQIAAGSLVRNVNLVGVNIWGSGAVGALAGANHGTIYNSSSTLGTAYGTAVVGVVAPTASVGGLVGENFGTVNDSYTSGVVNAGNTAGEAAGGLVGTNTGTVGGTLGIGSGSSVAVSGYGAQGTLGGLVGVNTGLISNSHATGSVNDTMATKTSRVGGLVGYNAKGRLDNSFYDISAVAINGALGVLSAGGLYNSQYQAWITTTTPAMVTPSAPITHIAYHPLDIANFASLQMLPVPIGTPTALYGISDVQGMKDMLAFSENAGYRFQLTTNVDLAAIPGYFVPYFAGSFDGGVNPNTSTNWTISNLSLTDATAPGVALLGMFGQLAQTGAISNLSVTNANITLTSTGGTIAPKAIGGLVGLNEGLVGNSSVTGVVNAAGEDNVGGLVGDNASTGHIVGSHATANVTGSTNVGGLVGINNAPVPALALSSNIQNSYTETGTVSGFVNVGGLIGNNFGNVVASYSAENVAQSVVGVGNNVGGLVGLNNSVIDPATLLPISLGSIADSYASGRVTGAGYTGGLVGSNYGSVTNTYATGAVSGPLNQTGGLIGPNAFAPAGAVVTNSYWDTLPATGTGQTASAAGVGLTTTAMHQQASFTGFDFTSATATWVMYEGYTAPLLRSFLKPLTVTATNVTKVFDGLTGINPTNPGLTYTDAMGVPVTALSPTPLNYAALLGAATYLGAGSAVGVYTITGPGPNLVLNQPANTGLYSIQQGYLLSYAPLAPATTILTVTLPPINLVNGNLVNGLAGFYAGLQLDSGWQLKNGCQFDQVEDDCLKLPGAARKRLLTVKDGGISLPDNGAHLVLPQM